jgi:LPS-assembly protein
MKWLFVSLLLLCLPLRAQEVEPAVYMEADKIAYDNTNAIVVAKGGVEVMRGERILIADTIYYYQKEDVVRAAGNVSLMQPDGNVLFAENVQLEDAFKKGVITQFRARMADNSAFAAAEARRVSDTEIQLSKAVYSPCKLCSADDTPLWQIKSDKVTIDDEEQSVEYRNATFEVEGVPIAYTPYFSHPTPDADRKSGLLMPEYDQSTNLGAGLRVPYYWNIAPDKDATITPWWTSKEGLVMLGEYRQLMDDGYINVEGSGTVTDKRDNITGDVVAGSEFRGHIFADGKKQLSDHWDWGFDINRTSDDTYLRRYRFGFYDTLISRAYTERMEDRNYAVVEGLAFQGLEEQNNPDLEPFVLPQARVRLESDPIKAAGGGRASLDMTATSLMRDVGADSRRLITQAAYTVPHVTDSGHVFEAQAGARVDVYDQRNVTLSPTEEFNGTEGRAVPHAALNWRYPLLTRIGSASLVVEPMAKAIASTRGHNSRNISNEDSLTPEFSDLNLFDNNRYAGIDRIEEGSRAIVGMNAHAYLGDSREISGMIGQNIQLDGSNPFPLSNEPNDDFSDVVGRVGYQDTTYNLDYRYRVDTDDVALRRSEVRALASNTLGSLSVDHLYIKDDVVLSDRDEITAGGLLNITEDFSVNAFGRRDLLNDAMIIAGAGATINYDCVTFYPQITRAYVSDRDFRPDTSITVRVGLKGLSE